MHPHRRPASTPDEVTEEMRHTIAANLGIPVEHIQYGNLGRPGKMHTADPHWIIFYREEWPELPWHIDGPLRVDWAMIRQWHG